MAKHRVHVTTVRTKLTKNTASGPTKNTASGKRRGPGPGANFKGRSKANVTTRAKGANFKGRSTGARPKRALAAQKKNKKK